MIRIHAILNEPFEGLGCIEQWITQHEHQLSVTRTWTDYHYPDISGFDMLIIMGGTASLYDPEVIQWVATTKHFIKRAIDSDKVVLGICLGAQLIAATLNANVFPGSWKEIGWFPVHFHNTRLQLPIPGGEMKVFHWHGDTFDLPEGATLLASSVVTPNQAFFYNDRVLALQFHLEITSQSLSGMLNNIGHTIKKSEYCQLPGEISGETQNVEACNKNMYKVLDFLAGKCKNCGNND